jgi:2,3,4,5-tetrahydropyridine-2-carboxylate N-succinyltransferase
MKPNEVFQIISDLNLGKLRVAEKNVHGEWKTNTHVKTAILEYFKIQKMAPVIAGDLSFLDKIPLKTFDFETGVRCVPGAIARYGSYIAKGVILMPSFVNIGAYVDEGSMIDTWATVGSCAQIGKFVHLSGGVGIGGVLEPIQASPVIIENHVFIGSRSIVVEGVVVEEGAVLGAGVTITSSTKIIDVTGNKEQIYQARVPAYSVVIPGTYQKQFSTGSYGVSCALIIGKRKESTDKKTSLNEVLREYEVSV